MPRKVAFIQNRVQRGGRFQVTAEMTRVLNTMGIVPDLYCYRSRITLEEIKRSYGAELDLKFIEIREFTLPFEWNILAFNKSVQKHLKNYDLVINSNNTSFGLEVHSPLISYVHFPRKYRLRSELKSIHFPEGPQKKYLDIANDPFKIIHHLYKRDRHIAAEDTQIVNSLFTGDCLLSSYPEATFKCIYPPVNEVDTICMNYNLKIPKQVVSLGRYSPDKRQLEQIDIAAQLPDFQFYIVGFINNESYFKQCQKKIALQNIKNVHLLGNASAEERKKVLDESSFFIHNLINEPFGITSVQAIASGCYPIVHNSGGQKEIVENPSQRFNDAQSAIQCFQRAIKLSDVERRNEMNDIVDKLKMYSASKFQKDFKKMVVDKLENK